MTLNPFHDGLRIEPSPGAVALVIFGASGDLTKRKLLPAIYQLTRLHRLPPRLAVVGVANSPLGDEGFRKVMAESLEEFARVEGPDEVADSLARNLHYLEGDLTDADLYRRLESKLAEVSPGAGVLFYLAIPPSLGPAVTTHLGAVGLSREQDQGQWRRIIVEKPFGTDLASARSLNQLLHDHFDEEQIFRIDHYLGKETVQNLMVFRFANGMFEPIWNRRYIDHVQITAAETVGVEQRAGYYDSAGALRDMVQNHLMQLLTLIAMEPPVAFTAESVRDRKMDALRSVQPIINPATGEGLDAIVRAQYADGWVDGHVVPGYCDEPGVNKASTTETFVALKVQLDSWRWAGVPFYLRTAKRLPKRVTEIAIQFKRPPLQIFKQVSPTPVASNLLIINVQPDEGISLRFEAKLPSTRMQLAPVMMNFRYGSTFGGEVPEAYETLLLDALIGDPTLFARHDFVEASWALISPIHQAWAAHKATGIPTYEAGEWGPAEAHALINADGYRWRTQ
ncbi:MAG: glucose-6-phosphate dehydrogenase [Acidobacteriota bacterium]|nr:glucose-6-phosphate dehydrogenase [Acidobacteriota bacterium]MDQ3420991.1 glucose-6-phosphate dehydrogenase [Acidobacteriota bacterium]